MLAITVITPALAGCLLLLSWLQHRRVTALAVWGSGFITASVAITLIIVARGTIPDFLSIIVGNSLLAAAYGILWCGARTFDGKKVSILLALLGVVFWLIACSIGPIYARPEARATVIAAIGIIYTLLAVLELWRGRGDEVWRWPIMVLLLVHAVAIPIHIPLAGEWTHPDPSDLDLLSFAIFEGALVSICAAYLFGGLVKDRIAARYLRASLTDPLTGVANRRGFFDTGERLLARARFAREPTAFVVFDLDRFKSINDRYGHALGDAVLRKFCDMTVAALRPHDLFGRLGGEEFAMVMPGCSIEAAYARADRIRAAFVEACRFVEGHQVQATVSGGVSVSETSEETLDCLLGYADAALYDAKAEGRNRIKRANRAEPVDGVSNVFRVA
jgi:diguanylate cyclase (GGDEF)-like protein